jgi:Ca2+-binding RTX toxin-like protein
MADITGTGNADILNGTSESDVIQGLGGGDTIDGGAGNDTIYGGSGTDTLLGGDGDDTFIEDQITGSLEVFNGGAGFDTIELRAIPSPFTSPWGMLSPHALSSTTSMVSIERLVFASQVGEVIQSTLAHATWASAGITQIVGGAGRDFLTISAGAIGGTYTMPNLPLSGWDGLSTNAWDASGDFVVLSANSLAGTSVTLNALSGATFFQVLSGGAGDDTLNGSSNADSFEASRGADQVSAGGGNDAIAIVNSASTNGITWNAPSTFTGAGGVWDGGAGTDVISIGGMVDLQATLVSIEGVHLQAAVIPATPITSRQDAAHLILDQAHLAMLPANAFFAGTGTVEIRMGTAASFDATQYTYLAGANVAFWVVPGSANSVTITGGAGNDSLAGTAGNDTLNGGAGSDALIGGAGDDFYRVDGQGDVVYEEVGAGNDTVEASGNYYLSDNVETLLVKTGAGDLYGVGNALNNTVTGNEGANLLLGGAGIDYLAGGTGDDVLRGEDNPDAIHGEDGNDQLYGGSSFDTDIITGGEGNDTIFANSGLGDYDILNGGGGDDTYYVDTPDDIIYEGSTEGTDTVYCDINGGGFYMWAYLENAVLIDDTPFVAGNELNNRLTGSDLNNWLLGNDGNDTLIGGKGDDVLFGDLIGGAAGVDTFVFNAGDGQDVIGDFHHGEDKIQFNGIFADFAAAQANFVQFGGDGAIDLGGGNFLVLQGVTMSTLTATDFIFG